MKKIRKGSKIRVKWDNEIAVVEKVRKITDFKGNVIPLYTCHVQGRDGKCLFGSNEVEPT